MNLIYQKKLKQPKQKPLTCDRGVEKFSIEEDYCLTVPGLHDLSPNSITAKLPGFDPDAYRVSDPLNPSENLPQVTEGHHRCDRTDFHSRFGSTAGTSPIAFAGAFAKALLKTRTRMSGYCQGRNDV